MVHRNHQMIRGALRPIARTGQYSSSVTTVPEDPAMHGEGP